MALQKSTTAPIGVPLPSAYARIIAFQGNKEKVGFTVAWYADHAARTANKPVTYSTSHSMSTPAGEMLTSLYDHLKTLPEFAGATDV